MQRQTPELRRLASDHSWVTPVPHSPVKLSSIRGTPSPTTPTRPTRSGSRSSLVHVTSPIARSTAAPTFNRPSSSPYKRSTVPQTSGRHPPVTPDISAITDRESLRDLMAGVLEEVSEVCRERGAVLNRCWRAMEQNHFTLRNVSDEVLSGMKTAGEAKLAELQQEIVKLRREVESWRQQVEEKNQHQSYLKQREKIAAAMADDEEGVRSRTMESELLKQNIELKAQMVSTLKDVSVANTTVKQVELDLEEAVIDAEEANNSVEAQTMVSNELNLRIGALEAGLQACNEEMSALRDDRDKIPVAIAVTLTEARETETKVEAMQERFDDVMREFGMKFASTSVDDEILANLAATYQLTCPEAVAKIESIFSKFVDAAYSYNYFIADFPEFVRQQCFHAVALPSLENFMGFVSVHKNAYRVFSDFTCLMIKSSPFLSGFYFVAWRELTKLTTLTPQLAWVHPRTHIKYLQLKVLTSTLMNVFEAQLPNPQFKLLLTTVQSRCTFPVPGGLKGHYFMEQQEFMGIVLDAAKDVRALAVKKLMAAVENVTITHACKVDDGQFKTIIAKLFPGLSEERVDDLAAEMKRITAANMELEEDTSVLPFVIGQEFAQLCLKRCLLADKAVRVKIVKGAEKSTK